MKTKTLKKNLDKLFSEYIRLKESKDGMCRCCSCGKVEDWTLMDAGHYVSRRILILRYDEKNVHSQCRYCNRFLEGNRNGYALYMLKKYGKKYLEELEEVRHKTLKMTQDDYLELIYFYKQKLKKLGG